MNINKKNHNNYQYSLESSKTGTISGRVKKFSCPSCGKPNKYVRYIDKATMQYLPMQYGKCDRADNCGYHHRPYDDGYKSNDGNYFPEIPVKQEIVEPTYIPQHFNNKLMQKETNSFFDALINKNLYPFLKKDIDLLRVYYQLGGIRGTDYDGAMTLPFIDYNGNICGIQVKTFDDKLHADKTTSIKHIIERYANVKDFPWFEKYKLNQGQFTCLFGAHLLSNPMFKDCPIFLVEAPKTALIGTLYFGFPGDGAPLWLATYNKSSFTYDRVKALEGREVYVFPDLSKTGNTYRDWAEKVDYFNDIMPTTKFIVSDFLERLANQEARNSGLDVADYLLRNDWRKFRINGIQESQYSDNALQMLIKNPLLLKLMGTLDLIEDNNIIKPF